MTLARRQFIFGLGATLAVIRTPGLLMPIRPLPIDPDFIPYTYTIKFVPSEKTTAIITHINGLTIEEWEKRKPPIPTREQLEKEMGYSFVGEIV